MEKFEKHINKYEPVIVLSAAVFVTVMFYGYYIHDHFSLDSYNMMKTSQWSYNMMLTHGRPFLDIIMHIVFWLGFNPVKFQSFYAVLMMSVIVFAVYTCYFAVIKYINVPEENAVLNKCIIFTACSLAYCNFFFREWFQFADYLIQFIGGLLFAILAVKEFDKSHCIRAFVFMCAALGFYQAVLGIFISWSVLIVLLRYLESENLKKSFWECLAVLAVGGLSSLENILIVKIAVRTGLIGQSLRTVNINFHQLSDNIKKLADTQRVLYTEGYKHMPDYFFSIILAGLLVCLAAEIAILKECRKAVWIGGMLLLSYGAPFLLFVFSESVWIPPRTIVSYMSVYAFLIVTETALAAKMSCRPGVSYGMSVLAGLFGMAVCCTNLVHVQKETLDLFETNELDYYSAKQIQYEIEKYEDRMEVTVDRIKWHTDTSYMASYPHVTTNAFDTNSRVFNVVWSWNGFFNYVMDRNFEIEEMTDDEYQRFFAGKNWDVFVPDDCLQFDGSVMYLIIN